MTWGAILANSPRMPNKRSFNFKGFAFHAFIFGFSISATAANNEKKPVVFVDKIQAKETFERLTYPAQVLSRLNARFNAETDGVVTSILKPVGSRVKKGELLLIIKNTDPAFDFAPLQVRASVSGSVGSIDVSVGSQVTKGQGLGSLIDPSKLKVFVEVPASDLSKIHPKQNASLTIEGGETEIPLSIESVAPIVDASTGTGRAELIFSKPLSSKVMPGLIARVEIKSDVRQAILVAQDNVVYREGKKFIRLVEDNKAKFHSISLGKTQGENVEVLSGLKEGDIIIARSSSFVADGQEVSIYVPEKDDTHQVKAR